MFYLHNLLHSVVGSNCSTLTGAQSTADYPWNVNILQSVQSLQHVFVKSQSHHCSLPAASFLYFCILLFNQFEAVDVEVVYLGMKKNAKGHTFISKTQTLSNK